MMEFMAGEFIKNMELWPNFALIRPVKVGRDLSHMCTSFGIEGLGRLP
jgi:hypothetical protein